MMWVDTALLVGIFWRMGGFQAAVNALDKQVASLRARVSKLEKEQGNEKLA